MTILLAVKRYSVLIIPIFIFCIFLALIKSEIPFYMISDYHLNLINKSVTSAQKSSPEFNHNINAFRESFIASE